MKRALLALLLVLSASAAFAHSRSESYSDWYLDETSLTAVVTVPVREVTRLPDYQGSAQLPSEVFRAHLQQGTKVSAAGEPCKSGASTVLNAAAGFVRIEMKFDCGTAAPSDISYRAMFAAAPSHVHYAKFYRNGNLAAESLITDTRSSLSIPQAIRAGESSLIEFIGLGIAHISGGYDHLAFVIGLLLLAGTLRNSVIAVSGFTLGHSVSLAAATLGLVGANALLVEALIGFTVALVALEYFLTGRQDTKRFALAAALVAIAVGLLAFVSGNIDAGALIGFFGIALLAYCYLVYPQLAGGRNDSVFALLAATTVFGLIHGFGFAGFLIETGMIGQSLATALLGFNIGVEFGQLAVVGLALLAAKLLKDRVSDGLPQAIAAALCGLGLWWFLSRALI